MAALIEVEQDAPPVVRAIARDLAACLDDRSFAAETDRVRGVVGIRSTVTPEAATIRIGERISIAHGIADDADVVATADLARGDPEPRIEDADEHPRLAEWITRLLGPPPPPWPDAAERFWAVLSRMSGAPRALRVVELESGDERRFGADGGPACELHGVPEELVAVFTGRVSMMEAAYDHAVLVRCSFPDLSVLSGAGFRIRYGGTPNGA